MDSRRGRLVGLDFSRDMLRKAEKRKLEQGWKQVDLVCADATQMKFRETFDSILFAYSLTMIPAWEAALDAAFEHLNPGGRMVVLDFGTFDGWGPARKIALAWLGLHHVEVRRPHLDKLRALFPGLKVRFHFGGYNFLAVGEKPAK
jgi:S-adenosylmethionine-diacylgycerolhomoserine-N-methlytransferase